MAIASEASLREVVPERDTVLVLGRGKTASLPGSLVVADVVAEVFGRDNALLASRRLVLASAPDAARVSEFLKTLPPSFRVQPSLFDFAQSFVVPSAEKY